MKCPLLLPVTITIFTPQVVQGTFLPRPQAQLFDPPRAAVWELRGGDTADLAEDAFGWASNLGGPAALVAGAVIATLYENLRSGDLALEDSDTAVVRVAKKVTRILLLTSFALQIVCIFVTTVTGTMLLSRRVELGAQVVENTTPLAFFQGMFELEYLTARLSFLQGLVNWLLAIVVTHALPTPGGSAELNSLNNFIAASLFTTVAVMLSFYNGHMSFYNNYFAMLRRWAELTYNRYFGVWPPRPMNFVTVPSAVVALYWFWRAFTDSDKKETKQE